MGQKVEQPRRPATRPKADRVVGLVSVAVGDEFADPFDVGQVILPTDFGLPCGLVCEFVRGGRRLLEALKKPEPRLWNATGCVRIQTGVERGGGLVANKPNRIETLELALLFDFSNRWANVLEAPSLSHAQGLLESKPDPGDNVANPHRYFRVFSMHFSHHGLAPSRFARVRYF